LFIGFGALPSTRGVDVGARADSDREVLANRSVAETKRNMARTLEVVQAKAGDRG
jgi:hypothetical protein